MSSNSLRVGLDDVGAHPAMSATTRNPPTVRRMLMIGAYLLCPRRDLDPRLWARGNGWIVGLGAGTVVPVRLRRLLHDDRRRLYHDLRWVVIVGRRVVPPWPPPKRRADHYDPVPMKVAVESVVPVKCGGSVKSGRPDKSGMPAKSGRPAKSGGPVETMAAVASAAMTPCDAW